MVPWGWELLFCSLFIFLLHWGPDSASIAAALAAQDGGVFWMMCLWQPLKGACSRGGFQHKLPPIPLYGLLMCGIIHKPMSSTYIHAWLVILNMSLTVQSLCLSSAWLVKISQCHEIWLFVCKWLNCSCFWSSSKDADLWKKCLM